MELEIAGVTRRPEKLLEIASAAHVISGEEIRRSGASRIPEALRLTPNIQVAQVDSRQWAISARGFNATTANKLLVLIDGRSVYTPLFSGVFWDAQDVFLPDIERIEIVRGPGGTLWGANAVNGIINVVSRSSLDSRSLGGYGYIGGGSDNLIFGGARYGGRVGGTAALRGYVKHARLPHSRLPNGSGAGDAWRFLQGGFRADWEPEAGYFLTLQGDVYSGRVEQPSMRDIILGGGNLLSRWSLETGQHSSFTIQAYVDKTHRRLPGQLVETLWTFDLDAQHRFALGDVHSFSWGAGARFYDDAVENSASLAFLPTRRSLSLITWFIEDQWSLIPDRLKLTAGCKFEHNDFTGFEFQPTVRAAWTSGEGHIVWGAVSRAVRTPSRIDKEFYIPGQPPHTLLAGGPSFKSEVLIAYEAGYRAQISSSISASVALFRHAYDDLRSLEPGSPPTLKNGLEATTYGAGVVVDWSIEQWARLQFGYNFFRKTVMLKPWSRDVNSGLAEGNDPVHQATLNSYLDVGEEVEMFAGLRFVGELPNANARVPAYVEADFHISWFPAFGLEISADGRNLLHRRHPEFGAPLTRREIPRLFSGRVAWRF